MATPSVQIQPLSSAMGATINGVDLSQPLDAETVENIQNALIEYQVIFFHNQLLSIQDQQALGLRFGSLYVHPDARKQVTENPEIVIMDESGPSSHRLNKIGYPGGTCEADPPTGSLLYRTTIPEAGDDTSFSNLYAAYAALSEPMQRFLSGLEATHSSAKHQRSQHQTDESANVSLEAVHPIVHTHPVTGRQALCVNQAFTTKIIDMPKWESDEVLAFLFKHIQRSQFQCQCHWQPNTLAFWDNRCVQYHASENDAHQAWSGHWMMIYGDPPFATSAS